MDITDEMLDAFEEGHDDCGHGRPGDCCTRAGLERVAPLIAAQALRLDAERVDRIVRALEEQDRSRPLVDFWHESVAARCWVRPDWDAIVKAVAGHLGAP